LSYELLVMKEVEYNYISGYPNHAIEHLNRAIGQYKRNNEYIKVGITGRNPQTRFNEHLLDDPTWERMVVIYKTTSENFANTIEEWLVENHWEDLYNRKAGGGSELTLDGDNFVYVLLG